HQNRSDRRPLYTPLRPDRPQRDRVIKTRVVDPAPTLPTTAVGTAIAALRLVGFLTLSLFATVVSGSLNGLNINSGPFARWSYRRLKRVLGLRVVARGLQSGAKPQLVVSNHVSYFDIITLGSLISGDFIAKADIAKWPVFGIMAKAGR